MGEGGRKLGILEDDVLLLDTEDEIAVLMDFCIHDVRRRGVNAVEGYLESSPPAPDSDEWILLQALRASRFSLLVVESVERGVGVDVRDLLRDETLFLVDVGFGSSASRGMVLAARVMSPEGIGMTTGAALPLGKMTPAARARLVEDVRETFRGMDLSNLAPEEATDFAGGVLRTCLADGAAERIAYVTPGRKPARGRSSSTKRPKRK